MWPSDSCAPVGATTTCNLGLNLQTVLRSFFGSVATENRNIRRGVLIGIQGKRLKLNFGKRGMVESKDRLEDEEKQNLQNKVGPRREELCKEAELADEGKRQDGALDHEQDGAATKAAGGTTSNAKNILLENVDYTADGGLLRWIQYAPAQH
ncbi:hypothetical protein FI667_g12389, partial [Globisporangium splendens]